VSTKKKELRFDDENLFRVEIQDLLVLRLFEKIARLARKR